MPVYEFYCRQCNTIYKFLSRKINTETVPDCPRCKDMQLEKKISLFATTSGKKDDTMDDGMPQLDEARMEKAMSMLATEAERMNEDDPRQMARMMRKLYDGTGLPLGEGMEEAMRRMETGEDPDAIEAEMGDLLDNEDFLFGKGKSGLKGMARRLRPPEVDRTLYDL